MAGPETDLGRKFPELDQLPCPHLRVGVNSGALPVDGRGAARTKDLGAYLRYTGFGWLYRRFLIAASSIALVGSERPQGGRLSNLFRGLFAKQMDLTRLLPLVHTGTTFHVDGRPQKDRVDWIFDHYAVQRGDRKVITLESLAEGQLEAVDADPGKIGHFSGMVEMTMLLSAHGRTDENGGPYLTREDFHRVLLANEFRDGWTTPAKIGFAKLGMRTHRFADDQKTDAAEVDKVRDRASSDAAQHDPFESN